MGGGIHDRSTRLWDLASGKCVKVGEGIVQPLMFSVDGKSLLLSRDPIKPNQDQLRAHEHKHSREFLGGGI